jgi:hypothetical protein
MKIGNNHVRQSASEVRITVDGMKYAVYSANWKVDGNKRRYVANKLKTGKITPPKDATVHYETTIVYATEDNQVVSSEQ